MRKIPALLTVLGLAALSLAGCTSAADGCVAPDAADPALEGQITVTGDVGTKPEIDVYAPTYVDDQTSWQTVTGEGTPITADNQLVVIDVTLLNATTGEVLAATAYDGDLSGVTSMADWTQTFPEFTAALECAQAGSRVVIALPPSGLAEGAGASFGLEETDSAVAVVDVQKVYLTRADGADQFIDARNMPSVVRAPDGRPGIIIPDADPPGEVTVEIVKKGSGDVVEAGDSVRIHATTVSWEQRDVLSTTWDSQPQQVVVDDTAPTGYSDALVGQTVGSQILLVVPAPEGGGDPAQVVVIDILGIDAPAPAG